MLDARCSKTSWLINQVELVNISEGGCCISGRTDGLSVGDEGALRIVGLRSIRGNVRWVEKRQAGRILRCSESRLADWLALSRNLIPHSLKFEGANPAMSG
jgi:hypothetical protein